MDYVLTLDVIDTHPEITIDEARANRLKVAREALSAALAIEEHYEILLGMYKSLERSAFNISMEQMAHKGLPDYDEIFDLRVPLNVGLISLLTAARLYLDTLEPKVRACLPESKTVKKDVKKLRSEQYDAHMDYRFMEQLRNHVQHQGLPVHSWDINSRWDDQREHRENSVAYFSTKERLRKNRKFKRKVLKELPDKVDLQAATRQYIDCLSHINIGVRALTSGTVNAARAESQAAIDEYRAAYGKDFAGLYVFVRNGEETVEKITVLLKWDDIRLRLQKKNPRPTVLRPAHVTTKIPKRQTPVTRKRERRKQKT